MKVLAIFALAAGVCMARTSQQVFQHASRVCSSCSRVCSSCSCGLGSSCSCGTDTSRAASRSQIHCTACAGPEVEPDVCEAVSDSYGFEHGRRRTNRSQVGGTYVRCYSRSPCRTSSHGGQWCSEPCRVKACEFGIDSSSRRDTDREQHSCVLSNTLHSQRSVLRKSECFPCRCVGHAHAGGRPQVQRLFERERRRVLHERLGLTSSAPASRQRVLRRASADHGTAVSGTSAVPRS